MTDTNLFVMPQVPATKMKAEEILALINNMTDVTERERRS